MTTTTQFIPAGSILTVTANAISSGTIYQLANPGAVPAGTTTAIAASTSVALGPFTLPHSYRIESVVGTLTTVLSVPDTDLSAVGPVSATTLAASGAATLAATAVTTLAASGASALHATAVTTLNASGLATLSGGFVLPTADPHVAGVWWDSAGTLTKSAG